MREVRRQAGEVALRDRQAVNYERIYRRLVGGWWDEEERRLLINAVGARRGTVVLDGGCGVGRVSRALRTVGCVVYGVDFSTESLKVLTAAADSVPGDINVAACDLTVGVPFRDASMDAVVSCQVVMLIPDRAGRVQAWRSMAAVARPGARLAAFVYARRRGRKVDDFDGHLHIHRYDEGELEADLAQAGWHVRRMERRCRHPLRTCPSMLGASLDRALIRLGLLADRARYLFVIAEKR